MKRTERVRGGAVARSFRLPVQKNSDDPWGVSLPMPGADLWYPKRGNLMLVWDVEELFSTGMPDQTQPVSILVVSVMTAVRWLEVNAGDELAADDHADT